MNTPGRIDTRALINLKGARDRLTWQQYKTLRGQVLAGDPDGAMRGLRKILQAGHQSKHPRKEQPHETE